MKLCWMSGSQCSFEMLGIATPLMQHHIPEDHCENLKIYMWTEIEVIQTVCDSFIVFIHWKMLDHSDRYHFDYLVVQGRVILLHFK